MPIAIPGIALACAAIFAVIILWATGAFAKAVAGLIPKDVPIIGRLHNLILAIGAVAIGALQWIMADIIGPAFAFIAKPVLAIVQFIEAVQQFGRSMASSWIWLLNSALPAIIRKVQGYAHTLVTALRAYVVKLYRAAEKYAHTLVVAARAYALSLYHKAVSYAHDVAHAIKVYAHDIVAAETAARVAAVAVVHTYAHDLYRAVEKDLGLTRRALEAEIASITSITLPDISRAIAVGVQQAEDYANTAVVGAIGALTTDVVTPVAQSIDGLIDDVGKLAGVIGTDLPDIRALVDEIPLSVPLSIAGVTGLSLALSRVAIKYMERCGVPNCRNLSKMGRDLSELFDVVEGVALLGLIGYIAADPEGAAREANQVLSPLVSELVDGARNLIGV